MEVCAAFCLIIHSLQTRHVSCWGDACCSTPANPWKAKHERETGRLICRMFTMFGASNEADLHHSHPLVRGLLSLGNK